MLQETFEKTASKGSSTKTAEKKAAATEEKAAASAAESDKSASKSSLKPKPMEKIVQLLEAVVIPHRVCVRLPCVDS